MPKESAVMGMPNEYCVAVDADHMSMTKFKGSTNEAYQLFVEFILRNPTSKPKIRVESGNIKTYSNFWSSTNPRIDKEHVVDAGGM